MKNERISFLIWYTSEKESSNRAFWKDLDRISDILRGYKVSTVEIADEAFLSKGEQKYQKTLTVSDTSDIVDGTILEVTVEELLLADKYEPKNYKRIKVMLGSGKKAWIYVAMDT